MKDRREENKRRWRAWRKRHPESVRQQSATRYAKHRAWLDAQKDKPCADCRKKYPPYVMDFDHIRGKKLFRLGTWGYSRARNLAEIAKCEVVCSNCHRERGHRAKNCTEPVIPKKTRRKK